jgi:hypothetical protein
MLQRMQSTYFSVFKCIWVAYMGRYKGCKAMCWLIEPCDVTGNVPKDKINI